MLEKQAFFQIVKRESCVKTTEFMVLNMVRNSFLPRENIYFETQRSEV